MDRKGLLCSFLEGHFCVTLTGLTLDMRERNGLYLTTIPGGFNLQNPFGGHKGGRSLYGRLLSLQKIPPLREGSVRQFPEGTPPTPQISHFKFQL